jgi:hypothetical protein
VSDLDRHRALLDLLALLTPAFTGLPEVDDLKRMGYLKPYRVFPSGKVCAIMPLNGGTDMIAVGIHGYGHADAFYYRAGGNAAAALDAWDGEGEPQGWWRNPRTGRRRTDGDPAREYIQF